MIITLGQIFVLAVFLLTLAIIGLFLAKAAQGFSSYEDSDKNIQITGRDKFGYPIRETKKEYRERQAMLEVVE